MPVVDTEFLFALSPGDPRHGRALRLLSMKGLKVPDTALLEFQVVLRARGRKPGEIAAAMNALKHVFKSYRVREVSTIGTELFVRQAELEEKYGLSYFDSMIAASALAVDGVIVSDDRAFDRVPGLRRIPLG
ncbi:type II toxin-antitoxin system VapC family toxin [Thermofilum pendens]|uniref:Ribonuclease VapC n=1 Tax=Thermofilum pendens (strain DSM 2475 / Hrk 5) TaxID=368408 RepID=A1S0M4_THEPD|nr:PIN domain-containing protein [Thermofilum pendens]ABL79004.1 PilT protein domain protein [Thermofilum pendens Hrk 5]